MKKIDELDDNKNLLPPGYVERIKNIIRKDINLKEFSSQLDLAIVGIDKCVARATAEIKK
jgi:hypothetical protein